MFGKMFYTSEKYNNIKNTARAHKYLPFYYF